MIGIFLDTETNGLNPHKHCLLELAYKILDVETGALICQYQAVVAQSKTRWDLSDPNSLLVNGFSWDLVCSGTVPEEVSGAVITSFAKAGVKRGDAVFICQNPSFDRAFFSQLIDPDLQEALGWPYHWLDLASMYWATSISKKPSPWETGVSKDKISENYTLAPEQKPHRAMNGVDHLISCYEAVVGFPQKLSV
ncbi:MAG: 3'-5' exonuclease [Simkaniaceae bacterium]|nr:3'-5' exonuclease [Candidatus Sacchlamyda saccharinae]